MKKKFLKIKDFADRTGVSLENILIRIADEEFYAYAFVESGWLQNKEELYFVTESHILHHFDDFLAVDAKAIKRALAQEENCIWGYEKMEFEDLKPFHFCLTAQMELPFEEVNEKVFPEKTIQCDELYVLEDDVRKIDITNTIEIKEQRGITWELKRKAVYMYSLAILNDLRHREIVLDKNGKIIATELARLLIPLIEKKAIPEFKKSNRGSSEKNLIEHLSDALKLDISDL